MLEALGYIEQQAALESAHPAVAADVAALIEQLGRRVGDALGWDQIPWRRDAAFDAPVQFLTDDRTGRLPLETLPFADTCLGLAVPVARSLALQPADVPRPARRPRALIVPSRDTEPELDLQTELTALSQTLGRFCGVEVWERTGNEVAALIQAMDRCDIVHFCGHVVQDETGLAFQLDANSLLRPAGVATLATPPWLVWMNACRGGLGGTCASFARACVQHGTTAFIGAATPVSDVGAVTASRLFYRSLARGATLGKSILAMRRRMAELALASWAGIALFGDSHASFPWARGT